MERGTKYAIITFLLWVVSPLILSSLVYLINSAILDPLFAVYLFFPAIILSVFSYFISKIKKKELRIGTLYAIIGASIWASPAIYFLQGSYFYNSISKLSQFLLIILPTALLAILFFLFGKNKTEIEKT